MRGTVISSPTPKATTLKYLHREKLGSLEKLSILLLLLFEALVLTASQGANFSKKVLRFSRE